MAAGTVRDDRQHGRRLEHRHLTFTDWAQADAAPLHYLDNNPPDWAATTRRRRSSSSRRKTSGTSSSSRAAAVLDNDDITKPEAWSRPTDFFPGGEPPGVTANKGNGFWLDFFVICDDANCHLFFSDDDGELFRSQTKIGNFPNGFGDAVVAIQGVKETVFEGGMTYRIKGKDAYLTLVEAFGPTATASFDGSCQPTLDGVWTPLAGGLDEPVRGQDEHHVHGRRMDRGHQSRRLIRNGYDQELEIDPTNLQLVYRGADPASASLEYSQSPGSSPCCHR